MNQIGAAMVRLARATTVLCCCVALPLSAQAVRPITIPGLGTIAFPVSTQNAAAETAFVRGALLLHVFEYADAAAAFRAAQKLDPDMAMAYWGEAMTFDHPVWDEENLAASRAALAKYGPTASARETRAPTSRERAYLHAVNVLFGPGEKARRDTLYSRAMKTMVDAYPADDEARAFYALSRLGLSQGVRDVPTYLEAAATAESIFARNPRHPGAAHYWIHGRDDPEHAAAALPAARALSAIAPDAGHAQHMTSHIFMALGMWDDVVRANENATRVVAALRATRGLGPSFCGHYNFWLEYGYLQQGRRSDALALMRKCRSQATPPRQNERDPDNSSLGSAVAMWSRYIIDAEDWSGDDARWTPEFGKAESARNEWEFARGLAAARRGDLTTLRDALAGFRESRARLLATMASSKASDPNDAEYRKQLDALGLELDAAARLVATPADPDSAIVLLRRATRIEDGMAFAFGPPSVSEPSHEMLGDLLLTRGRFTEAASEFEAALRLAPGRAIARRGLERARARAPRAPESDAIRSR